MLSANIDAHVVPPIRAPAHPALDATTQRRSLLARAATALEFAAMRLTEEQAALASLAAARAAADAAAREEAELAAVGTGGGALPWWWPEEAATLPAGATQLQPPDPAALSGLSAPERAALALAFPAWRLSPDVPLSQQLQRVEQAVLGTTGTVGGVVSGRMEREQQQEQEQRSATSGDEAGEQPDGQQQWQEKREEKKEPEAVAITKLLAEVEAEMLALGRDAADEAAVRTAHSARLLGFGAFAERLTAALER